MAQCLYLTARLPFVCILICSVRTRCTVRHANFLCHCTLTAAAAETFAPMPCTPVPLVSAASQSGFVLSATWSQATTQKLTVCVCMIGASLRGSHRRKQTRPGEQPARGSKPHPPPVQPGAPLMFTYAQQKQHWQYVATYLYAHSVLTLAKSATCSRHLCSSWACSLMSESLGRCPK